MRVDARGTYPAPTRVHAGQTRARLTQRRPAAGDDPRWPRVSSVRQLARAGPRTPPTPRVQRGLAGRQGMRAPPGLMWRAATPGVTPVPAGRWTAVRSSGATTRGSAVHAVAVRRRADVGAAAGAAGTARPRRCTATGWTGCRPGMPGAAIAIDRTGSGTRCTTTERGGPGGRTGGCASTVRWAGVVAGGAARLMEVRSPVVV